MSWALENCPRDSIRNQEYVPLSLYSFYHRQLPSPHAHSTHISSSSSSSNEPNGKKLIPRLILTYLIPLNLLSALIPSPSLLQPHPRLQELFTPFIRAIQSGNIREYDERLEWAQPRLVGCNVYLVVERAREGCLRVLFKKA